MTTHRQHTTHHERPRFVLSQTARGVTEGVLLALQIVTLCSLAISTGCLISHFLLILLR